MKGYTLIETIITLFIVSVGIIALSKITISTIRTNSLNGKMTAVTTIVQNKIEQLRREKYTTLQEGTFVENDTNEGVTLEWTIEKNTPVLNTALVVVNGKWMVKNIEKNIQLSTTIGK